MCERTILVYREKQIIMPQVQVVHHTRYTRNVQCYSGGCGRYSRGSLETGRRLLCVKGEELSDQAVHNHLPSQCWMLNLLSPSKKNNHVHGGQWIYKDVHPDRQHSWFLIVFETYRHSQSDDQEAKGKDKWIERKSLIVWHGCQGLVNRETQFLHH